MKAFVVDVNVAIVANGQAPQADLKCWSACLDSLVAIQGGGRLVLDDRRLILEEGSSGIGVGIFTGPT